MVTGGSKHAPGSALLIHGCLTMVTRGSKQVPDLHSAPAAAARIGCLTPPAAECVDARSASAARWWSRLGDCVHSVVVISRCSCVAPVWFTASSRSPSVRALGLESRDAIDVISGGATGVFVFVGGGQQRLRRLIRAILALGFEWVRRENT